MERSPMLLDSRLNIIKMAILPNSVYRFNTIPIEIPTQFFTDLETIILNFIWKIKKPRRGKTILFNKGNSRGIPIPDIKFSIELQ